MFEKIGILLTVICIVATCCLGNWHAVFAWVCCLSAELSLMKKNKEIS